MISYLEMQSIIYFTHNISLIAIQGDNTVKNKYIIPMIQIFKILVNIGK